MSLHPSQRLDSLPISAIRRLVPYATAAKKHGVHVYHLNIGDPDVRTPNVMIEALQRWKTNPISYAPSVGTSEFIAALTTYYHSLGHTFLTDAHIISTIGGSEGINMALFTACDPGDEVLVFEPFYSSYNTSAVITNVTLKAIPTQLEKGFHLPDKHQIIASISPRTKAILFSNPCNPTGTVYTQAEIEMLVDIAREHDLYLISDEVYREYNFTDRPVISLLSYIRDLPDRIIVLDSLSKRYSLCGSRLGVFITLDQSIYAGVAKYAIGRLSGGTVDQHVGAQLTKVPKSYFEDIRLEYMKRRDYMYSGLQKIPGVHVSIPEGAFYIMARLPVQDSETFCIWLLQKYRRHNTTLMLAPGAGFYATPGRGTDEVRIAYVLKIDDLKASLEILEDALNEFNSRPVV